jgi:hypothetical protein
VQNFRLRAQAKPHTKACQVRQMWPGIKTALAAGHRLKDIRTWLMKREALQKLNRQANELGGVARAAAGVESACQLVFAR